jgi:NAD(P)H-hydrate epimerase
VSAQLALDDDAAARDGRWRLQTLLSVSEMGMCDRLTIADGVPGPVLMENAGKAVTHAVTERWSPRPVLVLCGPGNNGGDGFVVARQLQALGWPVRLASAFSVSEFRGDARHHVEAWQGPVLKLAPETLDGAELIVDALFGSGLNRSVIGPAAATLAAAARRRLVSVAIDVPSGIAGDSGAVLGIAVPAALTVTFFRAKPGHYLLPGRSYCGELLVADIGIPDRVLDRVRPRQALNGPCLWRLPRPQPGDHKYSRGSVLIRGGAMTGAARLAARGTRRSGAGMTTIAGPAASHLAFAADQPGVIVRDADDAASFADLAGDRRISCFLLGPGNGRDAETKEAVVRTLAQGRATLLDADALTAFAGDADGLARAIAGPTVLTPHDGEFAQLFGPLPGDKLAKTRSAARQLGATILLKGGDTVIAHPDGRAVINANGPPDLATAGSGDVLAGIIAGLLAQGLPPFEAAAAGAWLHGAAGEAAGPGLIAEDLPEKLPDLLCGLRGKIR